MERTSIIDADSASSSTPSLIARRWPSLSLRALADGVDAALLDCFKANLAVSLRFYDVSDVRCALGRYWRFEFREADPSQLPQIEPSSLQRQIRPATGMELVPVESHSVTATANETPIYAIGDAFDLPWLPYHQREHMLHAFLIDGYEVKSAFHVVDCFTVATRWGVATPCSASAPVHVIERCAELAAGRGVNALSKLARTRPPQVEPWQRHVERNARSVLRSVDDGGAIRLFARTYSEHRKDRAARERFSHACWLVARSRAYHIAWLRSISETTYGFRAVLDALEDVALLWNRVSAHAYVFEQRAARALSLGDDVFRLLTDFVHPAEIAAAAITLDYCEKEGRTT